MKNRSVVMKKIVFKKLNNKGSTFVLAIIIITLVTTLAVAVLTASLHNVAMKAVDRNSKDTFYTSETVLDEIRAGVGLDTMSSLAEAYESVLKNIIKQDASGYSYIKDNDTANEEFKEAFIDNILNKVSGGTAGFAGDSQEFISTDPNVRDTAKTYLKGYISGYDEGMADISSVGNIRAYKDSETGYKYILILEDVVVKYKEEKSGEIYFADVTADLEIEFPNMTVDFSNTNRLDDFKKYSLIADDSIVIDGCTANVNASMYAGARISVLADSLFGGKLAVSRGAEADNVNVICGGNVDGGTISVTGNANYSSALDFNYANIWCTNMVTSTFMQNGKDATQGAGITIADTCKTFVKDDLTVEGAKSDIDVNGEYYGYSYDGNSSLNLHTASSAIIINGADANLTVGTSKMILGGHAYIEVTGDGGDYMTGEALSLKGAQEVYLVPDEYLGINYENNLTNPMPLDTWNTLVAQSEAEGSDVEICNVTGFFAYTRGYLGSNAKTCYTVRNAGNGLVYVYLDFKDKASAASYIEDVAGGVDSSLKAKLDKYTKSLFKDGGAVSVNSSSSVYTKGALLEYSSGSAGAATGATPDEVGDVSYANSGVLLSTDEFVLTSMDLSNRYDILSHLLADIPWTDEDNSGKKYIVNDIDSALWQKKDYLLAGNEMSTTTIFDVIIDREMLEAVEYNTSKAYIQYEAGGTGNYIKTAINGSFTIPEECDGGIVVATGSVTVNSDFHGLILAGGDINISTDATFTTDETMIEYLITTELAYKDSSVQGESVAFKEYFRAYKHSATDEDSREEVKVETVDYKDIVNFNNWRKYED